MIAACTSGPPPKINFLEVGPAPSNSEMILSVRQPLIDIFVDLANLSKLFPQQFQQEVDSLVDSTKIMVFSLLPDKRGVVLSMKPQKSYPAQFIGGQLNLSQLKFNSGEGSGVRHFWSDPENGFGIIVFPNLIYSFWLDPNRFDTGTMGPEIAELIDVALQGSTVNLHPTALELSRGEFFIYFQSAKELALELMPENSVTANAIARLPTESVWAAGNLDKSIRNDELSITAGLSLKTSNMDAYTTLIRLLVASLLAQADLIDQERLKAIKVMSNSDSTVSVTGLDFPVNELVSLVEGILEDSR